MREVLKVNRNHGTAPDYEPAPDEYDTTGTDECEGHERESDD
jgi:hypothetical protein